MTLLVGDRRVSQSVISLRPLMGGMQPAVRYSRAIPSANESFLLCLGLVDFPTVARIG